MCNVHCVCVRVVSHAQSLAAVKAYMPWLSLFYLQTHHGNGGETASTNQQPGHLSALTNHRAASSEQCNTMISSTLDAAVPLFTTQRTVRLVSSTLVSSLTNCQSAVSM